MTDIVVNKLKEAFKGITGDKRTLIRIISVVLILLAAVILRIYDGSRSDISIETADAADEIEYNEESAAQTQILFVDIGGAVEKPGVYEVSSGTRLFQVIDMAGGLSDEADTDHVNRASFVEDGQKIIIPVKGAASSDDLTAGNSGSADQGSSLININLATADELKTLNGIGDVTAEKIITYRSSRAFKSKEDIMSVDGIGSKTYEKIKDQITVN